MRCCATTASRPETLPRGPQLRPIHCLPLALWLAAAEVPAQPAVPAASLVSLEDRSAIESALGPGLLDTALPASPITDPAEFLPYRATTGRFRILRGEDTGNLETHRASPLGAEAWSYQLSRDETGILRLLDDRSLVMAGIEDRHTNALTRYSPAEPFLPAGLQAGGETVLDMAVQVLDREHPDHVQHQGTLKVSLRHLGDYRVRVPAGQFDTILLKADFSGEIGPAAVSDVQYRFLAKGIGLVAMAERRDVSAFVVYRDRVDVAKVLAGLAP